MQLRKYQDLAAIKNIFYHLFYTQYQFLNKIGLALVIYSVVAYRWSSTYNHNWGQDFHCSLVQP